MSEIFGQVGERVPDVPEPIRAYRAWGISHLGLTGYGDVIWPRSQPLTASCVTRSDSFLYYPGSGRRAPLPHPCPSPTGAEHQGYGCGIYAYKSLEACMAEKWQDGGAQVVFGEVLLWGDVYEHANGFRAEVAKPAAIYDLPVRAGMVTPALLAAFYDVPLVKPDVNVEDLDIAARQRDEAYRARMQPTFTSTSGTVSFGGSTFAVNPGASISFSITDELASEPPKKKRRFMRALFGSVAGAGAGASAVLAVTRAVEHRWGWFAFNDAAFIWNAYLVRWWWRRG